jgi:hypothetical protein
VVEAAAPVACPVVVARVEAAAPVACPIVVARVDPHAAVVIRPSDPMPIIQNVLPPTIWISLS